MEKNRNYGIYFFLLSIFFCVLFFYNSTSGLNLFGERISDADAFLFIEFRLPKAITAVLVGAALSLSGLLLQSLFRNPLVGPYVLGVSSGASLGVSVLIIGGGLFSISGFSIWSVSIASVLGAFTMLFIVLFFSGFLNGKVSLLLIGIMIGQLAGAFQAMLDFLANPSELKSIFLWNMGSLENVGWDKQIYLLITCLLLFLISFFLVKPLDALLLGEEYATNLGVSVKQVRFLLIIVSGVLTAIVTSMCGPLAFVGIAVPHICRMLFKTNRHVIILPAVLICGSIFMLLADLLSNSIMNFHIPINVVTSIIGVPIVIGLILKTRNLS